MDLLAFERKLDQTIARKRMEIQEAIKKPLTVCAAPASPGPSQTSLPPPDVVFRPGSAKHGSVISHTAGCSPLVEHELNLMWWGQHVCFFFFNFLMFLFVFERNEGQSVSGGGAERDGDTESEAGSGP